MFFWWPCDVRTESESVATQGGPCLTLCSGYVMEMVLVVAEQAQTPLGRALWKKVWVGVWALRSDADWFPARLAASWTCCWSTMPTPTKWL